MTTSPKKSPQDHVRVETKDLEEEMKSRVMREKTEMVKRREEVGTGGGGAVVVERQTGRTTGELLDKRGEAEGLEEAQSEEKKRLEERRKRLKERERAAEGKAEEVRAARETFERFKEENDERLRKAEEKHAEESEERKWKEKEIERMKRELADLTELKSMTGSSLETLTRYQRFLGGVVDQSDEFADARGIIERWRTLKESSAMLEGTIATRTGEIEARRAELQRESEEKTKEVLGLTNRIAALRIELQEVTARVTEEEKRIERMLGAAVERTATSAQITMACQNLLTRVDKGGLSSRIRDPIQQLETVCSFVEDVKDIVDSASQSTTTTMTVPIVTHKPPSQK